METSFCGRMRWGFFAGIDINVFHKTAIETLFLHHESCDQHPDVTAGGKDEEQNRK